MAVWTYGFQAPLKIVRKVDKSVTTQGSGYVKTVIHSPAVSRADGTGSVSSYRGQNIFSVKLDTRTSAQANNIIDFLQARLGSGCSSFQIYNPAERSTDSSGSALTGMYWVKFLGDMSWIVQEALYQDFVDLVFEEDLTAY